MADTIKDAWDSLREVVLGGLLPGHRGNLLPNTIAQTDRIILMELARETALANGMDLHGLEVCKDFAQWVGARRPDPTRDQWLWLYLNIGACHSILSVDQVVGMMAGRDALLSFLRSAPDLRFVECYEKFFDERVNEETTELSYPQLEEAIQNDVPAKLDIFRILCRNITDDQLLARASALEKPAVVCSLLKKQPPGQRVPALIKVLRRWGKPEELLSLAVNAFGLEIASWRDDYGNGFFWYLYARDQPVSEAMIEVLPDEIIANWESPNRYGLAASDLWQHYRAGLSLPE